MPTVNSAGARSRIRIFVVAVTLRGGGAERQTVNLLGKLDRSHFEPCLYLFKEVGVYLDDLPEGLARISPRARHKYELPKVLLHLRRTLLSWKPHIVYSNLWPENMSVAAVCRSLPRSQRPRTIAGLQNNPRTGSRRRRWEARWLLANVDGIVACSHGVRKGWVKIDAGFRRAQVIPNAVDIARVRKLAKEPLAHRWIGSPVPLLIAVGRLVEQKGYEYLLQALQILLRRRAARLLILGSGPLRSSLDTYTHELRIEDHVEFLGFQPNPFKYVARADLFVLSSLWEGLPTVLLEAMALGVPVVATRAPYGTEEVIQDGSSGCLVPIAQPQAMADSLDALLQDPDRLSRLGRRGKSWVEENYSATAMASRFGRLFRELVSD
jgi:glycosyltransferase involved in cell wall biosynthesis